MQDEDDDWITKLTEGLWPLLEDLTSTEEVVRKQRLSHHLAISAEAADASLEIGDVVSFPSAVPCELAMQIEGRANEKRERPPDTRWHFGPA